MPETNQPQRVRTQPAAAVRIHDSLRPECHRRSSRSDVAHLPLIICSNLNTFKPSLSPLGLSSIGSWNDRDNDSRPRANTWISTCFIASNRMISPCLLIFPPAFGRVNRLIEQENKLNVAHVVTMGLRSDIATSEHVPDSVGASRGKLYTDRILGLHTCTPQGYSVNSCIHRVFQSLPTLISTYSMDCSPFSLFLSFPLQESWPRLSCIISRSPTHSWLSIDRGPVAQRYYFMRQLRVYQKAA